MYFVTMGGMSGYVSFTTTPSGRAAIGLTDTGKVRLLAPGTSSSDWTVLREWPASAYPHTDWLVKLADVEEPQRAEDLLSTLPAEALG
ncbi:MAG: hypothetical protein FJ148_02805 [Deltaproteobacteria bacterium]|nr:hypothetical protein [Deltaproteobacteria bacterium]